MMKKALSLVMLCCACSSGEVTTTTVATNNVTTGGDTGSDSQNVTNDVDVSTGSPDASTPDAGRDIQGMDGAVADLAPDLPSKPNLDALRNLEPLFRQHENASQAQLIALGFSSDDFTMVGRSDNGAGPGGQGQFRIGCQYSHFGYDDPIVLPARPGNSHLHMFWGNTNTNAFTAFNSPSIPGDANDILESGGGTCQAFELNRSAYWMPALIDDATDSVVIPDNILLYYKSHRPADVNPMPQGLQMLAGNVEAGGFPLRTFAVEEALSWSCGDNGFPYNKQNTIPQGCSGGDPINATIQFPQCLAVDGNGDPVLTSDDFLSHTLNVNQNDPCPGSHPYRIPQISYLIYFPNGTDGNGAGVANWRLSSDDGVPGGSLHGDWLGAWNDETVKKWTDGCFDPGGSFSGPRNCSNGQTGQNGTGRIFRRVSNLNDYTGPNFLEIPRD